MKVIATIPFKNEEKMLPTFLSNVTPCVDEVIGIDDNSTDRSAEIMKQAGVHVYKSSAVLPKAGWAELNIRQRMLELGRDHGGTHFVALDADETFTGPFRKVATRVYEKLEPGQKVKLQWLALWKSVDHYKDDSSVWSNNYKDFIFRDDGKMEFPNVWMHTPRTPGPTNDENCLTLNPKHGAVLHFQFSNWNEFQIKQAWYRCTELIEEKKSPSAINQKFSITKDDPNSIVKALPEEWKNGVAFPELTFGDQKENWRLQQILKWFEEFGPDYFKDLDIWHVPEIQQAAKE